MNVSFTRRRALQMLSGAALLNNSTFRAFADTANAAPASLVTAGPEVPMVPALFGASGGGNLARLVDDKQFMNSLGKLAPSIFRYPGGNGANWFDISTGVYVKNPVVPRSANTSKFDPPFTFGVLKEILRQAHAEPSIVLNLLTGDFDSQMAALKSAHASGISMKRIELGNEYYLRGAAAGTTAYEKVFPTAADYARVALKYAKALRSTFPECEIAVPILARDSNGARENAWNENLLKNIDRTIDSVIAHIYRRLPPAQFGANVSGNPLSAPGGPQTIFAAALDPDPLDVVRQAVHSESRRIWVTETNIGDPGHWSTDTWAHALGLALNMMNMLSMPRVEQVLCWSILGDRTFSLVFSPEQTGNTAASPAFTPEPGTLTGNGYACMLLFRAARDKTTARQLEFTSNEMQTSSSGKPVPSLYGWQYGADSALVLNLSPKQHALNIRDPRLARGAYYQLAADATKIIQDQNSFAISQGKPGDPVVLPPYSMTHVYVS